MEKGEKVMDSDFFAKDLLMKLDQADPVFAAYEAQDVSRNVGFDFANFQDVVPRALDEIRETIEAYNEGPEQHAHLGDEIADIMFSLVNLARHAGISQLSTFDSLEADVEPSEVEDVDLPELVSDIGNRIEKVAHSEKTDPDKFVNEVLALFESGMKDSVLIALTNGFIPKQLLIENIRKYLLRCEAIEQLAAEDGKRWADLAANNEIIDYWKRAKALLK